MLKEAPVLLVDSSPTLLLLEKTLLSRRGWKIESTETTAAARSVLSRHVPSMIFSAVSLPDGSGADLCRTVRNDQRTKDVPFLFVVGRNDEKVVADCRDAGASEILFKPLKGTEVDSVVNHLLGLEVRRWNRKPFHTLVEVGRRESGSGAAHLFASSDISPEGMAVETDAPHAVFNVGSRLAIRFFIPDHQDPVVGEAEVVWHRQANGKPRYGLRFHRLEPGATQRIAAYGGFSIKRDISS